MDHFIIRLVYSNGDRGRLVVYGDFAHATLRADRQVELLNARTAQVFRPGSGRYIYRVRNDDCPEGDLL